MQGGFDWDLRGGIVTVEGDGFGVKDGDGRRIPTYARMNGWDSLWKDGVFCLRFFFPRVELS